MICLNKSNQCEINKKRLDTCMIMDIRLGIDESMPMVSYLLFYSWALPLYQCQ